MVCLLQSSGCLIDPFPLFQFYSNTNVTFMLNILNPSRLNLHYQQHSWNMLGGDRRLKMPLWSHTCKSQSFSPWNITMLLQKFFLRSVEALSPAHTFIFERSFWLFLFVCFILPQTVNWETLPEVIWPHLDTHLDTSGTENPIAWPLCPRMSLGSDNWSVQHG